MVRILIREGQNINEQTQTLRNTPIHLAAQNGHILIVKYLIELNANVTIVNSQGKTAHDFAKEALTIAKTNNQKKPIVKGSLIDRLIVTEKTLADMM